MKECNRCHLLKTDEEFPFSTKGDKTKRIGFCEPCNIVVKEKNAARRADPVKHKQDLAGKKRYRDSAHGAAKIKEFNCSEQNKKCQQKYWKSNKGKESVQRRLAKHRKSIDLQIGVWQLLSGSRKTSSVVFNRTEFKTSKQLSDHLKSTFPPGSQFSMENYGVAWEVDHKIPRSAYDHDDDDDTKRCWSAANMWACTPKTNKAKNDDIDIELASTVPQQFWPKAWQGVLGGP